MTASGAEDADVKQEEAVKEEAAVIRDTAQMEEVFQEKPVSKAEDNFEPVIPQNDAEEDAAAGEVNPYTGREYQSNSVLCIRPGSGMYRFMTARSISGQI